MAAATPRAGSPPAPDAPRPDPARRTRRRFAAACAVSLVFHLTFVTVFRVVVYFPSASPTYYRLEIVSVAPAPRAPADPVRELYEGAPVSGLRLRGSDSLLDGPPEIELPALSTGEMERLRVRSEAGDAGDLLERVFADRRPTDTWGVFSRELQDFGQSLRRLAFPGETAPAAAARTIAARHRPAEGYEGYVVWDGAPADRELLFAPPIKGLWDVRLTRDARWPVELVVTVSPEGRVLNVWNADLAGEDLVTALREAVSQYRFAPLPDAAAGLDQMGVLFITPAGGRP